MREKKITKYLLITAIIYLVIGCWAMTLSPVWNGEIPHQRNQYEEMAQSLMEGHLWIDHPVDPKLEQLEDPYDPAARKAAGAKGQWDHAYYKGRYYMYFGIVPVLLLFLPYLALTGQPLTTFHGTQIFFIAGVMGLLLLYRYLSGRYFRRMPPGAVNLLFLSSCVIGFWYILDAPALYCTAISGGICFQIWSLYFLCRAVLDESLSAKRSCIYTALGALSGALVFGCRPPIGITSLILIPLAVHMIRRYRGNKREMVRHLACLLLPYILVGIGLMAYNYARFENPFEFGQTYQITVADQSNYESFFKNFNLPVTLAAIGEALFGLQPLSEHFPYLQFSGIFFEFPVMFCCLLILTRRVRRDLKQKSLLPLLAAMFAAFLLIIVVQTTMSPIQLERYKMDYNYLAAIQLFMITASAFETSGQRESRSLTVAAACLTVWTVLNGFLLFLVPWDHNFTAYYPEFLENLQRILG